MDMAIYMGLTKEDVEAKGIDKLLEGQKRFFGSLKDSQTQTAVINLDGTYIQLNIDRKLYPECQLFQLQTLCLARPNYKIT